MINRNLKRIIAILILIIMLFPHLTCFALTQARVGEIIAKYAYNFCMNYGFNSSNNQTVYTIHKQDRKYGYLLKKHSGTTRKYDKNGNAINGIEYTDKYPMDCTAFVDMVVHQALGLGSETEITQFATPTGGGDSNYFEAVSTPQPGDIGAQSSNGITHVWIYIGDVGGNTGKIAESTSSDNYGGARITNANYSNGRYYRILDSVASTLKEEDCVESPTGVDISSMSDMLGMMNSNQESEFYYNGVPDGKYSVAGSFWNWIIESLLSIIDFIINLITFIIRMVFVGWTAIVENLITYAVESVTGEAALEIDATNAQTNDNITIETIVFNKVKTFDVNFFDLSDEKEKEN